MQSIINNSGFGFCKASSFRNCNNCLYRLRCINYAPFYSNNNSNFKIQEAFDLRSRNTFETIPTQNEEVLVQENLVLKQKIKDLENQILLLEQSKNIEQNAVEHLEPSEINSVGLEVYENKNLDLLQQDNVPLKAKKGIFGTKYVEDKPKKK